MPTPAQHAEIDSLMSGRSPVPSLDIRRGGPGNFTADNAIPGLDINPPLDPLDNNGKTQPLSDQAGKKNGLGGWFSRMVGGGKGEGKRDAGGGYGRLDQDDD